MVAPVGNGPGFVVIEPTFTKSLLGSGFRQANIFRFFLLNWSLSLGLNWLLGHISENFVQIFAKNGKLGISEKES